MLIPIPAEIVEWPIGPTGRSSCRVVVAVSGHDIGIYRPFGERITLYLMEDALSSVILKRCRIQLWQPLILPIL